MKKQTGILIGLILLIQTLLVSAVLIELRKLSNSIIDAAVYSVEPGSVSLAWGSALSTETLVMLVASAILSILIVFIHFSKPDDKPNNKNKHKY